MHPVLRRADRRRVESTAPRMRRLSPPAGCGGCSVRGKPGRCLQDSVSTHSGTRVRHPPRPRRLIATSLRPCLPPGSTMACAENQPWGTYWRATSAVRDAQNVALSF